VTCMGHPAVVVDVQARNWTFLNLHVSSLSHMSHTSTSVIILRALVQHRIPNEITINHIKHTPNDQLRAQNAIIPPIVIPSATRPTEHHHLSINRRDILPCLTDCSSQWCFMPMIIDEPVRPIRIVADR
jgi:hypothetical protein